MASDSGRTSLSTLFGDQGDEAAATAAEHGKPELEDEEATTFVPAARLKVASTNDLTSSMNLSSLNLSSPDHSRASVS